MCCLSFSHSLRVEALSLSESWSSAVPVDFTCRRDSTPSNLSLSALERRFPLPILRAFHAVCHLDLLLSIDSPIFCNSSVNEANLSYNRPACRAISLAFCCCCCNFHTEDTVLRVARSVAGPVITTFCSQAVANRVGAF